MEKDIRKLTLKPHLQLPTLKRVAAYARVSTEKDQQKNSLEAQKDYFLEYIQQRSDWQFVGIYVDDGISGTSRKRRTGFNQMIDDALSGKIDYIVTKSISRFARNTLDTVQTVRQLKDNGIGVYFQKEDIHSLDGKGEFMLTLMASFAQEESRSISENCTWGIRKRFADGKFSIPYARFLGFQKGRDGGLAIHPKEARVVECIYALRVIGFGIGEIRRYLECNQIPSPGGKENWVNNVVKAILINEKYKGDALLQKTFTVDFMSKKKKKNDGELPQYYVENNHEAIVSREVYDFVQPTMTGSMTPNRVHSLGGKMTCKECGARFGSFHIHPEWKGGRIAWKCANKWSKTNKCDMRHLYDEHVHRCLIGLCVERLKGDERLQSVLEELAGVRVVDADEATVSKEEISIDVGVLVKEILVDSNHSCEVEWIDGIKQCGRILGTGRSKSKRKEAYLNFKT